MNLLLLRIAGPLPLQDGMTGSGGRGRTSLRGETAGGLGSAVLFRHLHDGSGCFRLERSPGEAYTHWKASP